MWFIILILILAVVVVAKGIRIIPQSEVYVVERLGKYHRTLESGVNLLIPFIDRVARVVSLREQMLDTEPSQVITKDNSVVKVDLKYLVKN